MQCLNKSCSGRQPAHLRHCPSCGNDAGAPNVRQASAADELLALEMRLGKLRDEADAKGKRERLDNFEALAGASEAIICMPISRLQEVLPDNAMLSTFGLQVEGQMRVPQDNHFDALRISVESAFLPNYSNEIRFAALSCRDVGHRSYGPCSVTLKQSAIANRASVFEYPLFEFPKVYNLKLGQPPGKGHRAVWGSRGKLAAIKLGGRALDALDDELPDLLLPEPTDTLSDCIEVHIFGGLTLHSFAKVVIRTPEDECDKVIMDICLDKLSQHNIEARAA